MSFSTNTNTDILIAGAAAAFTVDFLIYPLDTLKTRIQAPNYSRLYLDAATQAINRPALFRGLYQGVGSVVIATLPSSGAFFTTYEGLKSFLDTAGPNNGPFLPWQPLNHAIASSVSELVACAILTPSEVIKQNAQMYDSARDGGTSATAQTLRKFRSNPFGLWRGYTALAGRNLPFTAMQFPIFEQTKEVLRSYRDQHGARTHTIAESAVITAISAGIAGGIAATITTPIDVIKTRIMLAAGESEAKPNNGVVDALGHQPKARSQYSGWAIGRDILAEEGVRGLWRGGTLRTVWSTLGSALYLAVYDSGRVWLARRRGEDPGEDLS
ncbi:mitochondrial carrier protein [Punctularia strigosozonata HHB-11173 SS5]|uniref:mitochondrial carrier protein n=1 Tax=Punctularia strigosozonata (strain HHB-11173) TaxID=741275 RepID=UPI0004417B11|nr:mitochondrial carrier protein [Punctularia strigosozonata HHB-11173 SS5]EIN12969.1 mitochondrial carrier protein [Punctularia strigosozonata HHB-11173 SS5]